MLVDLFYLIILIIIVVIVIVIVRVVRVGGFIRGNGVQAGLAQVQVVLDLGKGREDLEDFGFVHVLGEDLEVFAKVHELFEFHHV